MKYTLVKELMTIPAITIDENTTIEETINLLKEHNIGFLPVTKSNIIIGVVTDRDILLRLPNLESLKERISNVVTSSELHFVSPETDLETAAKIMAKNKIRRLPVLNDGVAIGILTTKNLLKEDSLMHYIKETYNKNSTLNPYSIYNNNNPHDSVKTSDFQL